MDAKQLIEDFFSFAGFDDADIKLQDLGDSFDVTVSVAEEFSGMLIGYRGEKIDSLQKIITLMVNNQAISYKPINLDINGYRQKRTEQLEDIARTAATKAKESGREILLPPMPARERRLVHMFLADYDPQVTTYSEGEGSSRRIVVRPQLEDR